MTERRTGMGIGRLPEILDACCGGRHWWWDKDHPLAVYMDERVAPKGSVDVRPNWECNPDLVGDFRAMPFADESFQLVLFDPPHIVRDNPGGYMATKYGALSPDTEQDDLARGFSECWRVLAAGGTLVFKWGAENSLKRVEPHFPATPIVGTRSPRGGQTRWFIFYKPMAAPERPPEQVFAYFRRLHGIEDVDGTLVPVIGSSGELASSVNDPDTRAST